MVSAERSLVGGCLIDNDAYWQVTGLVSSSDFADGFLAETWGEIARSAERGDAFDAVTLSESTGLDLGDLLTLVNEIPGSANVVSYAKLVRKASNRRKAESWIRGSLASLDSDETIPELMSRLESLNRSDKPSISMHDALARGLDDMEQAKERAKKGGLIGCPTGIPAIDERTGGLYGSKLFILAARPSLGKTAMALQMAQAAAMAGHAVGFMSLEMSAAEIAVRTFAHQYKVNGTLLAKGDTEEIARLTSKFAADEVRHQRVKNMPLHMDEDTYSVGGIIQKAIEWHRKHNIKILFIDHLQLVELPKGFSRNDGLGDITRKLKILAKRLGIPVVTLCQFSRNLEKENRQPKLSDLRDSGNIEQDADIVLALHGSIETDHGRRSVHLDFLKNRGGVVGYAGEVMFDGRTQTFARMAYGYEAA